MQVEEYEFLQNLLAPPWKQIDPLDVQYKNYNFRYFVFSDYNFINIQEDLFVSISNSSDFLRIQMLRDDADFVVAHRNQHLKQMIITQCNSFMLLEVLRSLFPSYTFSNRNIKTEL